MEDKQITIKVDKTNKLLVVLLLLAILVSSAIIGGFIGYLFKLGETLSEIITIIVIILISLSSLKIFSKILKEQTLDAEFKKEYVVLKKNISNRIIYYRDIIEVQKIMVVDEFYDEKGYYRVKIKCKGRNYTAYSTNDEYYKHLDFEEVELSKIYYEFKNRGVKCC